MSKIIKHNAFVYATLRVNKLKYWIIKKHNKMENTNELNQEKQCDIHVVKHFYFKVNKSKLKDESKFEHQVNKVIKRIKSKHNVLRDEIIIKTGTIDDDFIYDRFRLRISVNCA